MGELEFSSRALHDLRKIDAGQRKRIKRALHELTGEQPPQNLDTTALVGAAPWQRLRVGTYRVIYRQMDDGNYLAVRVVHRRDLERAVDSLP